MTLFVAIILAYLIGSIPFGLLLAKVMAKTDPRFAGSGNIGATNMLRLNGKWAGALTLLLDAFKGIAAILLAQQLTYNPNIIFYAGLAAFLGHLYPAWLKFKGGKGIATGIAVMSFWNITSGLMIILTFAVVLFWKRYVSLAALAAAALAPIFVLFVGGSSTYLVVTIIMAVLIFIRHQQNIRNLRSGQENKL